MYEGPIWHGNTWWNWEKHDTKKKKNNYDNLLTMHLQELQTTKMLWISMATTLVTNKGIALPVFKVFPNIIGLSRH